MSIRRTIAEVDLDGLNVSQFCAQHGVSRWLFYDIRKRYQAGGEAVLELRSRAPKVVANRLTDDTRDLIVVERKRLEELNLDAGPATIKFHLAALLGPEVPTPSEATIWRVLRDRGFIIPEPNKAPKHAYRAFTAGRANECWQIDSTKWALGDGTGIEIINVIDDCTRVAIASVAVDSCTTAAAWDALCVGASRWGWPERLLSDNARAFRGSPTGGGGLEPNLRALGITPGHSRPYHPQTCGKVERFHQTLKKFLAAYLAVSDRAELQAAIDRFIAIYNNERPHRALRRRPPVAVWNETPRSGPAITALRTPPTISTPTVYRGRIGVGQWHLVTVGHAYNGQRATTVVSGLHVHVFIDGRLVRNLTLDPTRRTHPLKLG